MKREIGNIDVSYIEHLDLTIIEFEYGDKHGENNGVAVNYGKIPQNEINDAIEYELKKLDGLEAIK